MMRRMRRWLSGALCAVFLLGLLPGAALAAEGDTEKVGGENVLTLSDGTTVNDTDSITRAQMAEMVYEHERLRTAIDSMAGGGTAPYFTDINTCTKDQERAITALCKAGIVSGTSANTFNPTGTVTRAEAAVVFWRATGCKSNPTAVAQSPYSDVTGAEPYGPAVLALTAMGIIQGTGDDRFSADGMMPVVGVKTLLDRYSETIVNSTASWATGVTRLDMLMEVYEQYKDNPILKEKAKQGDEKGFSDIGSCNETEKAAIEFFTKADIISGLNTNPPMFQPYAPASSFQIALLLQRCAEAAMPSSPEARSAALYSQSEPQTPDLDSMIEEAFDFLEEQGIEVAEAGSNPHAPGLSDDLTAWTKAVAPEAPAFSPAGGTYVVAQTVTISGGKTGDGTVFYYTTNGDTPTTSSTQYSAAIPINDTTTLKAIAVKNNLVSEAAEATYTIMDASAVLSGLTIADGSGNISLTPDFAQTVLAYTAEVGPDVDSITVTPTVAEGSAAAITVNGQLVTSDTASQPISLNIGENTVTIAVTSGGDETEKSTTYTITITRPNIHTIAFDAAGGSVTPAAMDTTAEGTLASLPTPTRSGYRFEGWYTMSTGGNQVTTATVFSEDSTIYARWTYVGGSSGGSSSGGSSSSGVTGSGDDVRVSAGGGSVSASQMTSAVNRADEGAEITLRATTSAAITLPAGGMADAADNDNDVVVDLRHGEVTLSARAAAGLTDGASASDRVEVSITSRTGSGDETLSHLLDLGAAVFDVSVEVDSKSVHSFDGSLTITFTVPSLSRIADPHILHILSDGTREYYEPDRVSGSTITVRGIRNLSTFAVIPGSEVPREPVNPFADVDESDYYHDAVLWAADSGVTSGTGDGAFGPHDPVTRAQMVTFLWRAHGSPEATGVNPFTDVSESDYYYDAVLWAAANGVTSGTGDGAFSPETPVTRAQAVTFQWRAAGSPAASGGSFDDVDHNAYYVDAVTWAVDEGITSGTGGGSFSPDVVVTRAQAVTFLYRELG